MQNKPFAPFSSLLLLSALAALPAMAADSFTVTLDPPVHGKFELTPALPADGKYPAGTVVTVSTQPDAGYTLDAGYYSVPGRWGAMYHESMTPVFKVTIDQDKHIGASFIEKSAVAHIDVKHDIVYAKPGVKPLKYDVFTPKGAKSLPIIVIIHGGGWVTNDENVMRGLARELTRGGKFVVASIDYRWGGKADGDATSNTMANLIEDVFGAIAHIMEHAKEYGGDPTRILLTGDSAGGHLSAAASLMVEKIGDGGFGKTAGVFEFKPTYLPKGKSTADVRKEMLAAIKARRAELRRVRRAVPESLLRRPGRERHLEGGHLAGAPHPEGHGSRGAAVPHARHARSADPGRDVQVVHGSAGERGPARGIRAGRRRAACVLRLEAGRGHQGDLQAIRRVLRRGDEGVLRVGVESLTRSRLARPSSSDKTPATFIAGVLS